MVGISGGIDSAVVSTLAALTGETTFCVTLPIHQPPAHVTRAEEHIVWLQSRFKRVKAEKIDLTDPYDRYIAAMPSSDDEEIRCLTQANTRSRLRMAALYYVAGIRSALVVGTGNKVEDFGVGFLPNTGTEE